jgi:hypothetical protein
VFYSWFVVAVAGLNLSVYGLEGIEASMMMDPNWAVGNAMRVMMHGDHSWSGPGGWFRTTKSLVNIRSKKSSTPWPSGLWLILAFLTLLVFLALPISGLVMNLGSGYMKSVNSPTVIGFSYDSFNVRNVDEATTGAGINWQYAVSPRIPGMGVIYTLPSLDRSGPALGFLQHLPNSMPTGDGVSEIFLTSQAGVPIDGTSWGLALKYNCSLATDTSAFTILNHRDGSQKIRGSVSSFEYSTPNNDTIAIYNQTDSMFLFYSGWASNLEAVMELGYSTWPKWPWSYNYSSPYQTSCYNLPHPELTGDYFGVDQESVLEVLFWQYLYDQGDLYSPQPTYNMSLDLNITTLYGAYKTDSNQSMSAVGARCLSSSAVGTAKIDAARSTFSDFQRTDTPIFAQTSRCAQRFDAMAIANLFSKIFISNGPIQWLSKIFASISAPPALYAEWNDFEMGDEAGGSMTQLSMLQASELRNSLLNAYAAYAVQLAYNGGQGYSNNDGIHSASFINPNVTAYQPGTVLQPGVVPPIIPGILLLLWTFGSVILGCWYGFRRRWAETLDAYSMFVFGVNLADKVKDGDELSATARFEKSQVLNTLPGLIGDAALDRTRGRIGLVDRRGAASRTKWYV